MRVSSSKSMRITVLYFAWVRELAGTGMERFALSSPVSVAELLSKVKETHPMVFRSNRIILTSLNRKMMQKSAAIKDGDEVAIMPAVTGG